MTPHHALMGSLDDSHLATHCHVLHWRSIVGAHVQLPDWLIGGYVAMTEAKIRLSESATTITAVCYQRDIAGLERTKMWREVWGWLLVASLPETCWCAGPRLSGVA